MKRVFIIHGWSGSSEGDWIPWLKAELEKLGHEVITPDMPNTDHPVIAAWISSLAEAVGVPDDNTYFIGHSIGCQTILRYLETIQNKVGGALFVAPWFKLTNLDNDDPKIAKPWEDTPIDFEKIKNVLPKSITLLSDDDPYVPLDETRNIFKEHLGAETVVIRGAGHITATDGFKELSEALHLFKQL